jgi:amidase
MRGLEQTRRVDFEEWLAENRIDAVVFPAAADVAPADADVNPASADIAWRNGVWVSNGNLVPRHLGIPTVTIPMGAMDDTGMPVGLTVAGAAYSDTKLLQLARSLEALRTRRVAPSRTPRLADEQVFERPRRASDGEFSIDVADVHVRHDQGATDLTFRVKVTSGTAHQIEAFVDGVRIPLDVSTHSATATVSLPAGAHDRPHSEWRPPYGPLIVVVARSDEGAVAGAVATTDGSPL